MSKSADSYEGLPNPPEPTSREGRLVEIPGMVLPNYTNRISGGGDFTEAELQERTYRDTPPWSDDEHSEIGSSRLGEGGSEEVSAGFNTKGEIVWVDPDTAKAILEEHDDDWDSGIGEMYEQLPPGAEEPPKSAWEILKGLSKEE